MDIKELKKQPIMGILRGADTGSIALLAESIVEAGLNTVEITMNTPEALQQIALMKKTAEDTLFVGAGTVLSKKDAESAVNEGAEFIVSPTLVLDVITFCADKKIPVFPGAFTPQEVYNAWQAGATMVKVFPANFFGPSYFKELKGPFNSIELLACGGVTPENIRDYFSAGASAVAFGASIFKKEWLQNKDFVRIKENIKKLLSAYQFNKVS